MTCEQTNSIYPLLVDVYYPSVSQSPYGIVEKQWMLDSSIACFFASAGRKYKQDLSTERSKINIDISLVGRIKKDIRISDSANEKSIVNIILTNIRDSSGTSIYNESSGPRTGLPTIFEIASIEPVLGPFGKVDYYKAVIRRSENQAVTV
jgi:hypothetical protein